MHWKCCIRFTKKYRFHWQRHHICRHFDMQAPGADASPRPSLCLLGWRPVSVGVDSPWGQPGPACPLHRRYHQHPPTAAADNITHATSTINLPPLRLYLYRIRCSETNPCSLWGQFFCLDIFSPLFVFLGEWAFAGWWFWRKWTGRVILALPTSFLPPPQPL